MKHAFWEFLWDDPPTNADTSSAAPSTEADASATPSLLSNPTEGSSDQTGAGAEGAQSEGGEAAGAEQSPAVAFDVAQLQLPEGVSFSETEAAAFAEVLNSDLSPQERGQKLVELYLSSQEALNKAGQEAAVTAWNEMNLNWRKELEALPEFEGNVSAKLGEVKQALITLGADQQFFQALDLTGAGNNPHVVKMLAKLTVPYIEGQSVGGTSTSTAAKRATALAAMYPTMQIKG